MPLYTSFRRIFIPYFAGFGSSQRSFFSFTSPPTVDRYPFTISHLLNVHFFKIPEITRHESGMDYIFLLVNHREWQQLVVKIVVCLRKFSDLILAIVKVQLKFSFRRHNCQIHSFCAFAPQNIHNGEELYSF